MKTVKYINKLSVKHFMKYLHRVIILIVPILFLFFIFQSCKKSIPYSELKKKLNINLVGSLDDPDSVSVYVDASMSMQGFANNNDFQFLIKNILSSFTDPAKVEFYLFDTSLIKVQSYNDLFNSKNYRGYRANLDQIFGTVSEKFSKSKENLFVVLTDFQFNNQNIYVNTLIKINKLLNDGAVIKLFEADFDFDGLIFPQFVNNSPYHYKGKRPIYIFIIGRLQHLNFISDFIKNTFNYQNSFTLSKDIFVQPKLDRKYSGGKVTVANEKQNHFYLKDDEQFKFCTEIQLPELYENDSLVSINFELKGFELRNENKLQQKDCELVIDSILYLRNQKKLRVFFSNIEPLHNERSVYVIGYLPNKLPDWIINYSAMPQDNQATKTVYLSQFFQDIFRPVNDKNYLFKSYFILEIK
ncbi:MAG: hypothetical protein N2043_13190 [Ignavibacterium sp.]|nr:hypothetical protein [Ignavibacterium sp.]